MESDNDKKFTQADLDRLVGERKFTQADVDRFISDRLQREKATHGDNEALKAENIALKAQLTTEQSTRSALEGKQAVRDEADLKAKIATEEKLPAALIVALTGKTEPELRAHAKLLVAGIGPGPAIGSATNPASPPSQRFTREQVEKMRPEEITKNWATIEAQMADGSLNRM
jgi:hypothetical protein